jgi:hypothetical protein
MLYTIEQLKRRIDSLLISSFSEVTDVGANLRTILKKDVYVNDNKGAVKAYISQLKGKELTKEEKMAVDKLAALLNYPLNQYTASELSKLISLVDSYYIEAKPILNQSRQEQEKLSVDHFKAKFK